MRRTTFTLKVQEHGYLSSTSRAGGRGGRKSAQFDWTPIKETLKTITASTSSLKVSLGGKPPAPNRRGTISDKTKPLNPIKNGSPDNLPTIQEHKPESSTATATESSSKKFLMIDDDHLELLNRSKEVIALLEQTKSRKKKLRRRKRVFVVRRNRFQTKAHRRKLNKMPTSRCKCKCNQSLTTATDATTDVKCQMSGTSDANGDSMDSKQLKIEKMVEAKTTLKNHIMRQLKRPKRHWGSNGTVIVE